VRIGHLDPHDEDSGWQARLVNLGYIPGTLDDITDDHFRWAVEEFQCDHHLKVTGKLDDATRAKLKDSHGV
jgi:peptidoglycan hydrolase-like protein with peptidoglycan-binding domain